MHPNRAHLRERNSLHNAGCYSLCARTEYEVAGVIIDVAIVHIGRRYAAAAQASYLMGICFCLYKNCGISATVGILFSFYGCKNHAPNSTKGDEVMPNDFIRRVIWAVIESFPIDEAKKRSCCGTSRDKKDLIERKNMDKNKVREILLVTISPKDGKENDSFKMLRLV